MTLQESLLTGGLIVLPTDTVYGIGANPFSSQAVRKLLEAKGRGPSMPPPVLAASTEAALSLVDRGRMSPEAWQATRTLAHAFWPGALTLVVPTSAPLGWEMDTVAVRVPDLDLTRDLLQETGPLAVTSANLTGTEPALTVSQARDYFGEEVAVYVDGGQAPIGVASTIVDLTEWPARILREGALDWGRIIRVLEGT